MTSPEAATHTLHHDPVSICSVMVRYTYALRGEPKDSSAAMTIHEQPLSIRRGEHLAKDFLCNINRNGEVPVLVSAGSGNAPSEPMPDSMAITYFLASRYPSLLPEPHESEVKRLVEELHHVNFFSLTFTGKPEVQRRNIASLQSRLENEEVSERYRKILEDKIERVQATKLNGLTPESVDQAIENTEEFMAKIDSLLQKSQTGWIMNTVMPTALDAHVIVFICRLQDVHRQNLIPGRVEQYGEVAMSQEAWKQMMDGRRTVPPGGF